MSGRGTASRMELALARQEAAEAVARVKAQELALAQELPLELEDTLCEMERRGVYTLERFQVRRPDAFAISVRLLQECVSPTMVAELVRADIRTINAVVEKLESENAITPFKMRTARELRGVITLVLEELRKAPETVGAIGAAVLIDKHELLTGQATQRVEHVVSVDPEELRWREEYQALLAGRPVPARVREVVAAEMGSAGEEMRARAALPEGARGGVPGAVVQEGEFTGPGGD